VPWKHSGQYSFAIPSDPSLDPELHPMSDPTDPDFFLLLKSMSLLDVLSSFEAETVEGDFISR